ncbi:sigma-70 family RNA polymerase sigma factor [Serinibacter arcticus]|uniref:sigma-70 family RNA polymerase sigma factor n=1 Tax=Serinibacter arcticus TaxID=1655435 RepID=UPI0011B1EEF1|nr:sigma-70 family RNA polymerase sigma factor [Serinibacter arcticus]
MTMSHTRTSSVRSDAPAVDLDRYRNLRRRGTTIARSFRLNEADVEDVVQDALVRMLRVSAEGEGSPRRYESYFDSTVRHLCIDLLRKRGRETELPEPEDLPEQTRSEKHEQRMLVRQVLAELPASARSILVKSHIEGRTLSEISGELGISSNACSAMLYRARRTFRDRYVRSHVLPTADERCAAVRALMVDTTLSPDSEHEVTVRNHRRQCDDCESQYAFLLSARSAAASALLPGALAAATSGGAFAFLGLGKGGSSSSSGGVGAGAVGVAAAVVAVAVAAGAFTLVNRTGVGPDGGAVALTTTAPGTGAGSTSPPVPPAAPTTAPSDLPTSEPVEVDVPVTAAPVTTTRTPARPAAPAALPFRPATASATPPPAATTPPEAEAPVTPPVAPTPPPVTTPRPSTVRRRRPWTRRSIPPWIPWIRPSTPSTRLSTRPRSPRSPRTRSS